MPSHNTRPGCPLGQTASWLATVLCGLLLVSGCRNDPDGGYREVTGADIAPAARARNPSTDLTGGGMMGGNIKLLPDPVSTGVVASDTVEAPVKDTRDGAATIETPADPQPLTGTDPVNPLRPALADGGPARTLGPPGTGDRAKPREIKLLVKERSFQVVGPGKALRISYDDFDLLKVLNMEPVPPNAPEQMPAWLLQLDGKRIRVRGFMYPTFQDPVEAFVLARDNQICCFGRNPKIYDLVRVALRKGVTSPYIQNRPFDVVGLFHIAKKIEDGRLLYSIDDAVVVDR